MVFAMEAVKHVYEVRPRKDKRGVDLISDALPFGRLWYAKAPDAVDYAKFYSRSDDGVIRGCDKNFRVCDRDQPPSTLIFDSKIPPVLAVRAA